MRLQTATGNFGIGTSAPNSKLHIVAGTDTYTNLLNLDTGVHLGTVFGVGGTANNESVFGMSVYRGGQYFTRMYVDQFGRVSLQPNGDGHVGIGTSAPNYRLDVQGGAVNAAGGLCIAGDCKTAWAQVGGSQWTTGGANVFYNSGNVGIGTGTPSSAKLVISGSAGAEGLDLASADQYANLRVIRNSNSVYDKDLYLQYGAGTNSKTHFYSNNAESMTLTAGNVGIGTTAPATKLHVVGDLTVTGNISAKYQDVAEWVQAGRQITAARWLCLILKSRIR